MPFTIHVGSDLWGAKHNVILPFPGQPSVSEVVESAQYLFDVKSRACRPAGYPDTVFQIESIQLLKNSQWHILTPSDRVEPFQQLWCFQPESIWHSDASGIIPDPLPSPFSWSSPRGPRTTDIGPTPTFSEKLMSVFYQLDAPKAGTVPVAKLRDALHSYGVTPVDPFEYFVNSGDPTIRHDMSFVQWSILGEVHTQMVDVLFFRMRDGTKKPPSLSPRRVMHPSYFTPQPKLPLPVTPQRGPTPVPAPAPAPLVLEPVQQPPPLAPPVHEVQLFSNHPQQHAPISTRVKSHGLQPQLLPLNNKPAPPARTHVATPVSIPAADPVSIHAPISTPKPYEPVLFSQETAHQVFQVQPEPVRVHVVQQVSEQAPVQALSEQLPSHATTSLPPMDEALDPDDLPVYSNEEPERRSYSQEEALINKLERARDEALLAARELDEMRLAQQEVLAPSSAAKTEPTPVMQVEPSPVQADQLTPLVHPSVPLSVPPEGNMQNVRQMHSVATSYVPPERSVQSNSTNKERKASVGDAVQMQDVMQQTSYYAQPMSGSPPPVPPAQAPTALEQYLLQQAAKHYKNAEHLEKLLAQTEVRPQRKTPLAANLAVMRTSYATTAATPAAVPPPSVKSVTPQSLSAPQSMISDPRNARVVPVQHVQHVPVPTHTPSHLPTTPGYSPAVVARGISPTRRKN